MRVPIWASSNCSDKKGRFYKWEISVVLATNHQLYPEGVKAVFRLMRVGVNPQGENELVECAVLARGFEHLSAEVPGDIKMKLKSLEITFKDLNQYFVELNEVIKKGKKLSGGKNILIFDSPKTWRSFMNSQKLEVLTSVSRLRPASVYQLAKNLGRPAHHVLKDCRELESFGFINLKEENDARRSLRPELIFNYDFIRVDAPVLTFLPVSARSIRLLEEATSA